VIVSFSDEAWQDLQYWIRTDKAVLKKLLQLVEACRRTPHTGIGKPEPLRKNLSGLWSRRITDEHRLVYRVVGEGEAQTLQIMQCRGHY
jgi:toxin YoeB